VLAFASWGLFPLYWKPFAVASQWETLGHRVLWSFLVLLTFCLARGLGPEVLAVGRTPRRVAALLGTATLLSANWALFIYGVNSAQTVQTSLGYFLTPLVNILFGCLLLKERLSRPQLLAVALAAAGVCAFGWNLGRFPGIAVGIALTFGLYGLVRKMVAVSPVIGLLIETAWMTPAALAVITLVHQTGTPKFGSEVLLTALFLGAGIITTIPLFWFNSAAKLLPLSTMGFLQFLAPSLQLAVSVFVFHEPFTTRDALAFALIWAAIAVYIATLLRTRAPTIVAPNPD
jgi:chloramphenicol-sensitive protein RarD